MDGGFVKLTPSEFIQFQSGAGRMCIWFEHKPVHKWFDGWSHPLTAPTPPDAENRIPWFALHFWPTFARLYIAHWLLTLVAGTLAVLPWCPARFSLRGLLLATTVIAAIAGLIVWVDKSF